MKSLPKLFASLILISYFWLGIVGNFGHELFHILQGTHTSYQLEIASQNQSSTRHEGTGSLDPAPLIRTEFCSYLELIFVVSQSALCFVLFAWLWFDFLLVGLRLIFLDYQIYPFAIFRSDVHSRGPPCLAV